MTTPLLQARGIHKSYGSIKVLRGIDLDIADGETLAILGPNGAGKTTLFRVLSGEVPASAGLTMFSGSDVTTTPAHLRVRQGIGRTFQISRTFLSMTVRENMITAVEQRRAASREPVQPWWYGKPSDAIEQEASANLRSVGLLIRADQPAATLSHGDKKRLELAMTLALKPRLLMLDEPTAGMAPADRGVAVELLRRLKAEHHMTLVLTEHDMGVVFDLATRVMVLNYGETIALGTPDAVRADPLVRQVYLGHGMGHA